MLWGPFCRVGRAALGEGNKHGSGFSRGFKPQGGHRFSALSAMGGGMGRRDAGWLTG